MNACFLEMFSDEDDDKKTRKERDEERARKRVLTSSLLHDLRGDRIIIILALFKKFPLSLLLPLVDCHILSLFQKSFPKIY